MACLMANRAEQDMQVGGSPTAGNQTVYKICTTSTTRDMYYIYNT